jgi:acyl dehydratase
VGAEIGPVVKQITQEKINLFEACGVRQDGTHTLTDARHNFHTDPEAAQRSIGMATPLASGRMQVAFATEALRRGLGAAFSHGGTVSLRFVRPVVDGDTITACGRVSEVEKRDDGTKVSCEVWCENQRGERTSFGTATAVLPA